MQAQARLWHDPYGRLVGFALVDTFDNLRIEILPELVSQEALTSQMIEWGEACAQSKATETHQPAVLDASCREEDGWRIDLFTRHGFRRQRTPEGLELRTLHLSRSLEYAIPDPRLPVGFSLRPLAGAGEVEALTALHRAAFGTQAMTIEARLAIMNAPGYEPSLDLVVVTPQGRLAGYCTCQIHAEENARSGQRQGWADPIAVHPDFQRRGLGVALLSKGMQLLKQRGMHTAVLGTSSENQAMLKTAEAAGFRVVSAKVWLTRW